MSPPPSTPELVDPATDYPDADITGASRGDHGNPVRTLRRYRDLRLLFGASVVSDIGTWMQAVTVGTLVATTSHSAAATAMVMSALFLPQGLCSPLGGLLADRFDRRKMAMLLLALQTVLTVGLGLLIRSGVVAASALALVILVQGSAAAMSGPALQAITPQLVPAEDLMPALSLATISWNSGRIAGPILGVACTAAFGASTTIFINALTFLVPIIALAMVRRSFRSGRQVSLRRFVAELKEGAVLARSTPSMRVLLPGVVVIQLVISSLLPAMPFYGRNVLGGGSNLVTALFTGMGLGAMTAAALAPGLSLRAGRSAVARVALGMMCVGLALASLARLPLVAVLAVAIYGAGLSGFFVAVGSVVQRDAPESHRGRLVSIYVAVTGLTYGLGSMANGFVADHLWGLRSQLLFWAVTLASLSALVRWRRPEWYAMLDGTDPTPRWRRVRVWAIG